MSEPQAEGMRQEQPEPASRSLAWWVLGSGVAVFLIVGASLLGYRGLMDRFADEVESAPPSPEYTALRESEARLLSSNYLIRNESQQRVHLSAEYAMEKVLKEYAP